MAAKAKQVKLRQIAITIISICIALSLLIIFWNDIIDRNIRITLAQVLIVVGAIVSASFLSWRTIINKRRVNKQIEETKSPDETVGYKAKTVEEQELLGAVKILQEPKNGLEAKRKALCQLEKLAISLPAHRQKVLDFVNILNSWMLEPNQLKILKEKAGEDWRKWKNEKQILIPEKGNDNEQLLSAETPKIFENIIREHSRQWQNVSEQDKEKYKLNFSYFVFPCVDFSGINFLQEQISFSNAYFLGKADFTRTTFLGEVSFFGANFAGEVYFETANFSGPASFSGAGFSLDVTFLGATFSEEANFLGAAFSGEATFSGTTFSGGVNFWGVVFSSTAHFKVANFSGETNFSRTTFSGAALFFGVTFLGTATFEKANFLGEVDFEEAVFLAEVDFEEASYPKNQNLN